MADAPRRRVGRIPDRDPEETAEWAASLDAVARAAGPDRASFLMRRTLEHAEARGLGLPKLLESDYLSTIPTADEPAFPGDEEMERRITAWDRWNAAAMVTRGSRFGLGGHIKDLMREEGTGRRWVPIVPDEARTFGMESFFPTFGIYSPLGQNYDPVDRDQLLYYREAPDGQVLNEGITEAGSMASFAAAATSYATHGEPMIPFYIFYAMFGWQRTADQMWALADQLGRGFLVGATAGRTTMTGEGLQHADGHSHLIASTNPAAVAYDPAFAYEIAVIVREGLRRMYGPDPQDVFYYLTVYNEVRPQPPMPAEPGVEEGIVRGLYRFREADTSGLAAPVPRLQLLTSGTAVHWVLEAQELLAEEWGVAADVWSATSWSELRRDALECDAARLRQEEERVPYVTRVLAQAPPGPVLAVSDWMRTVPDQISQWVPREWHSMGTDGFGLSDTREAVRRHFGVDPPSIVIAALAALAGSGRFGPETVRRARERYGR
ncbi:hypothetical protein AB0N09_34415 [Streptomyces erythrochromogenes]